jgi:hypothetical protein
VGGARRAREQLDARGVVCCERPSDARAGRSCADRCHQVLFKVFETAELQPYLDAANAEKEAGAST